MNTDLTVDDLTVTRDDGVVLVGPNSFHIKRGTVHALVGESGSGKTLTLRALAGVIPEGLSASWSLGSVPTPRTAMIFQDPASFFNPRWRADRSLREVLRHVRGVDAHRVSRHIATLADTVGLSPEQLHRYPFQLSGGMVQRAGIAMALATEPQLLLADEITSALDPDLAYRILRVLSRIAGDRGVCVLLVSHDLRLVATVADSVSVLYRGRIVEQGVPHRVLTRPFHRYTDGMVRSLPGAEHHGKELPEMADPREEYSGVTGACPFLDRCPVPVAACVKMPDWDPSLRYRCRNPVQGPRDE